MQLGVRELSRRVVLLVRCDSHDHGVLHAADEGKTIAGVRERHLIP
jgi:hypothetical protein